jgi:hypothetical protein
MYDLKPDAPAEIRGEFQPIQTNVPGVQICELLPRQARMWDKFAVIRSVVALERHTDAEISMGRDELIAIREQYPSFGAVVSKVRGPGRDGIPPFVSLVPRDRRLEAYNYGLGSGYLGPTHHPFVAGVLSGDPGPQLGNLRLPAAVTLDRLSERKALLASFDQVRRDIDATGAMRGMDAATARALEIVTSEAVHAALDLEKEDPRILDHYGRYGAREARYGLACVLARRLVEAGVGCVRMFFHDWDTHVNNFGTMRRYLPELDQSVSALVEDLHERGLDRDVLVVMWGEFGRTPRINANAGRDHWGSVMSAVVAGGGLKMGQAIGSSTAHGEHPKDRPCTVSQVLSTLYHAMGIDPAQTFPNSSGRPVHILDDREPIAELL